MVRTVNITGPSPAYHVGTASWTDPTLLAAGFYPSRARTAEARLRFYAEHFNTVEVDSTYYALPSERNAALWALRTPDGFRFNIKAFAWLTRHGAEARALPQAVKALLPAEILRQPQVSRPPAEALALSFEMFRSALEPLRRADKLGCILLQFPPWFTAGEAQEGYLDVCRARLPDDHLAIEFRHASWFGERTQRTVAFLAERGLPLVSIDAPRASSIPQGPWIAASDIAYVRLHGRNRQAWFQHHGTAAQRFQYLYTDAELRECADSIRRLRTPARRGAAAGVREVYVIFNNCYADYGVRNALTMQRLLSALPA